MVCISIFMMGIGTMLYPMFFPVIAKDLPRYVIGILISIAAMVSMISAIILNRFIMDFGIEKTLLIVAFTFRGGLILLGFKASLENYTAFIVVNVVAVSLLVSAISANSIGT